MSKKRLFQVFDEMNVNDDKNKTATLACCFDMVEAKTAKGGGVVTIGVPAEEITKIFLGDRQPILLLLDKKEYHRLADLPLEDKLQAAEEKAARYEKALREIQEEVVKVENESIFIDEFKLRKILAEPLTPKTGEDE